MKAGSPSGSSDNYVDIDNIFTKRAILISLVIHALLLAFKVEYIPPEIKPREDAIKVDLATPER